MSQPLSVCLVAGGPSAERGISLNSARSVCDHLDGDDIRVDRIVYIDPRLNAYLLPRGDLYSNTPSDFDFALRAHGRPLTEAELNEAFRSRLVFPVIHGAFGEDGELQSRLEACGAAYAGSSAEACRRAFHKGRAAEALKNAGFPVIETLVLKRGETDPIQRISDWARAKKITWPFIAKPALGGSSIGVHLIPDHASLCSALQELFKTHEEVLLQPRVDGVEFTVVVLAGAQNTPVALLPTEVDKRGAGIFSYRQKYLPSGDVAYHTPPTFGDAVIADIRKSAERIFSALNMRDFARIDGWYLGNGKIVFSDINPVSGMEQNSFLFQQGARAGFSHGALLRHIVRSACRRNNLPLPAPAMPQNQGKQPIAVLFGGASSERQVSLMSGTNVWMKLRASDTYQPEPYLLTEDNDIWRVSYAAALNHTVEEVRAVCQAESTPDVRAMLDNYRATIRAALGLAQEPEDTQVTATPSKRTLEQFLDEESHVFLALHGGIGEDGTLQAEFERRGTRFNGSGSAASRLCLDKAATAEAISGLSDRGVSYPGKWTDTTQSWLSRLTPDLWPEMQKRLGTDAVVVKPRGDGCSTGVVPLTSFDELRTYLEYTYRNAAYIPDGIFVRKQGRTELPLRRPEGLIFEAFVDTDEVRVTDDGHLKWNERTKWIEVTVGVLGHRGNMHALNPSLTIALDGVLSLEEKFMGGTGINLTPPPVPPLGKVQPEAISSAKDRIALIANTIGLNGYARMDAFMHIETGEIQLIEVNTLPGLTASTVLFHQGLAETPSMPPVKLLETILAIAETPLATPKTVNT